MLFFDGTNVRSVICVLLGKVDLALFGFDFLSLPNPVEVQNLAFHMGIPRGVAMLALSTGTALVSGDVVADPA